MKEKKYNKIKRIVAIYLAVVFVLSAAAVFGVSAKTVSKEHRVEVYRGLGEYDSEVTGLPSAGTISDTFLSYPNIPGDYTTSTIRSRARNYSQGKTYDWKYSTLNENGGVVTVTYGTSLQKGDYDIRYEHYSGGSCEARAILSAMY